MNYKIKFMSGAELVISEELARKILALPELKGSIRVEELGGAINLSSAEYILPETIADKANENNTKVLKEVKCHDGSIAVKKFGKWVDQYSGAELDTLHYPELIENKPVELVSGFSKGLCKPITE
jgi:hypothetical protein